MKKLFFAVLTALWLPFAAQAQYTIYPVPHSQTAGTGTASFTENVTAVCDAAIDTYTRQRLQSILEEHGLSVTFAEAASASGSNVYIGVGSTSGAVAAKATDLGLALDVLTTADKFDRHLLSLTAGADGSAQLVVIGENTDAAFCGLASLEQMLDGGTANLPTVTINDYADQQNRGIVEGFYGLPYSLAAKQDIMRFMMRYKMNTYLYGAKCDYYHSNHWKDAYPTTLTDEQKAMGYLTQSDMSALTETAHECKVNFIWAIHPGNNLVNSNTVVTDVVNKFAMMYALGVRQFAVFADDVSVPDTEAGMKATADHITGIQQAIEARWNVAGAEPADTVRPLQFVPQIYCRSFAGSESQFNQFFQALSAIPEQVTVYTTGWGVWSVPNDGDFNTTQNQFGRKVAWWWNYPCNDNGIGRAQLYTMDMYSNFYDMPNVSSSATLPANITASNRGILSNPMAQGTAAKLPLFSVADYDWNNAGFNNTASWEAAFKALFPKNEAARTAYRFLAPYLRYYDSAAMSNIITSYKNSKDPAAIQTLMDEIIANCATLISLESSTEESDRLFYNDAKAWILKLHDMAQIVKSATTLRASDDRSDDVWNTYLAQLDSINALSTATQYYTTRLDGSVGSNLSTALQECDPGQQTLYPFVSEYLKKNALNTNYFGTTTPATRAAVFTNTDVRISTVTSGKSHQFYATRAFTLEPNEYVGMELPKVTLLKEIKVKKDTLLAGDYTIKYSADGKTWHVLSADEPYDSTRYVHYIVVVNETTAPLSLKIARADLIATEPTAPAEVAEATAPGTEFWQNHTADLFADGSPSTYTVVKANQVKGDAYTERLAAPTVLKRVRVYMNTTNGDYMTEGRIQASTDGQTWTDLNVLGTSSTAYTLANAKCWNYADDIVACDFDGAGITANYVRLYVSTPNTSKWLRLAEIAVNPSEAYEQPTLTDAVGSDYTGATDADPSTSTGVNTVSNKQFLYYFQNALPVDTLTLYLDPATLSNMAYRLSTDGGTTWKMITPERNGGVLRLILPEELKKATTLRINWTGTASPDIYEIVETATAGAVPSVTAITEVEATAEASSIQLEGGKVVVRSAKGIAAVSVVSAAGQRILSLSAGGATQVALPAFHTAPGVVIVTATLADGTRESAKFLCGGK